MLIFAALLILSVMPITVQCIKSAKTVERRELVFAVEALLTCSITDALCYKQARSLPQYKNTKCRAVSLRQLSIC